MAQKNTSYFVPHRAPIVLGSTEPNPMEVGSVAWSTIEDALVVWDGAAWQKYVVDTEDDAVWAATGFNALSYLLTPLGGGELGVTTTGIGVALMFRYLSYLGSGNADFFGSGDVGSVGWKVNAAHPAWGFTASNGTGSMTQLHTRFSFVPSDVGKIFVFLAWFRVSTGGRAAVNRGALTPLVNLANYLPGLRTALGAPTNGFTPATNIAIIAGQTFRSDTFLTDATALDFFDRARELGDLPETLEGALTTHRWSVRDAVKGLTVRSGRKLSGIRGLSGQGYYTTANGLGIRGTTLGFVVRLATSFSSLAGFEYVASCGNTSATSGWSVLRNYATIRVDVGNGTYWSITRALTAAELGLPFVTELIYDGSNLQMRVNGQQIGSIAATFLEASAALPMAVGVTTGGAGPAVTTTIFAISGEHRVPTLAESMAAYRTFVETGKLPVPTGPSAHHYEVDAPPGAQPPRQLLDKVGTDHLTTQSILVQDGGRAIGPFPLNVIYLSAVNTGLLGGTTMWNAVELSLTTLTGTEIIAGATNGSATVGWIIQRVNAALYAALMPGTNVGFTLNSGHLNRPLRMLMKLEAGQLRAWLEGVPSSSVAATFVSNVGTQTAFGAWKQGSQHWAQGNGYVLEGGTVSITDAEIAAMFAASTAAGELVEIPGKTSRRFVVRQDVTEANGLVPARLKDRQGSSDALVRYGGALERASVSWAGQVAVDPVVDTITRAPIDAMVPTSPVQIVRDDLRSDGRRTYGVSGYSVQNGYEGPAQSGAIPANTGFFIWVGTGDNGAGATWLVDATLFLRGTSGFTNVALTDGTLATTGLSLDANKGLPVIVIGQHVNGTLRLHADVGYGPAQVGSDVANSTLLTYLDDRLHLGKSAHFAGGAAGSTLYGFAWGSSPGGLTTEELLTVCASIRARGGRIQAVPNKTLHLWDVHQDVLDAGGAVPAVLKDRIGTYNLTRRGGNVVVRGDAVGGFESGTSQLRTADGGGIPGAATFWGGILFRQDEWINYPRILWGRAELGGSFRGWYTMFTNSGGGALQATINDGAGGYISTPLTAPFMNLSTRIGPLIYFSFRYDGVTLCPFINGEKGDAILCSGFTPMPGSMWLGSPNGLTYQAIGVGLVGAAGGHSAPSDFEMNAAALESLAQGKIISITSPNERVYDLRQDIADNKGQLPGRFVERLGSGDDLVRLGAPLVLSPRVERSYSFETKPLTYGARTFSAADHFVASTPLRGSAAGFHYAIYFWLWSQTVSSALRVMFGDQSANGGYCAYTNGTNQTLYCQYRDGAGATVNAPAISLASADVGKLHVLVSCHEGAAGMVRSYMRRVQQGGGQSIVGFTPGAGSTYVGQNYANQALTDGISILGWSYGRSIVTLSEVQALHDAVQVAEDLVAIPGKTEGLWSLKQYGKQPLTTIYDQVGNVPFTRVGTPPVSPVHHRSFGW